MVGGEEEEEGEEKEEAYRATALSCQWHGFACKIGV